MVAEGLFLEAEATRQLLLEGEEGAFWLTEEAYIIIFHIVFRLSLVSSLGQVVEVD